MECKLKCLLKTPVSQLVFQRKKNAQLLLSFSKDLNNSGHQSLQSQVKMFQYELNKLIINHAIHIHFIDRNYFCMSTIVSFVSQKHNIFKCELLLLNCERSRSLDHEQTKAGYIFLLV